VLITAQGFQLFLQETVLMMVSIPTLAAMVHGGHPHHSVCLNGIRAGVSHVVVHICPGVSFKQILDFRSDA